MRVEEIGKVAKDRNCLRPLTCGGHRVSPATDTHAYSLLHCAILDFSF